VEDSRRKLENKLAIVARRSGYLGLGKWSVFALTRMPGMLMGELKPHSMEDHLASVDI